MFLSQLENGQKPHFISNEGRLEAVQEVNAPTLNVLENSAQNFRAVLILEGLNVEYQGIHREVPGFVLLMQILLHFMSGAELQVGLVIT